MDSLYGTVVSISPKLMLMVSYDMRNEQVCKTINISRGSLSLHIIESRTWNLSQNDAFKSNLLEIGSENLDRPIFKLKLWKKHPEFTIISTILYHEKHLSMQNMCPFLGAAFLPM